MRQLFREHLSRVPAMSDFNKLPPDRQRFLQAMDKHTQSHKDISEPALWSVMKSHKSSTIAEQCRRWISDAQRYGTHIQGKVGHGTQNLGTRNVNIWCYEEEKLIEAVKGMMWDFNERSNWQLKLTDIETPQFCVYYGDKQSHYTWHKDCRNFLHPELGERKISMSMLLNSSDEFEGGDLEILDGISTNGKPLISRPKLEDPGDVVFFRSDQFHRVKPVTKGTRAALVVWCWGKGNF